MSVQVYPPVMASDVAGAPGWTRARRSSSREATRQVIVDTALRLFSERGYVGVRVEDIAREAGVSRATFYKHFAERDVVLAELFARLLGTPGKVVPVTGDTVHARVLSVLVATAERMVDHELLARFVYSLPVRHDAVLPGGTAEPAAFELVRKELEAAVARGDLRRDLPVDRHLEVLGRTFEAAMRDWAEERVGDPAERLRELVSVVFEGLAARPARDGGPSVVDA